MNLVFSAAHDISRDIICDNPVATLAFQLGFCVGFHLVGFGGEADDESWTIGGEVGQRFQNVGVLGERHGDGFIPALELELGVRLGGRTPVSHRGD